MIDSNLSKLNAFPAKK